MNNNKEDEIVFIGKITSSITHEIKNVFASIKELTGLMDDLVSLSNNESIELKDKFQKIPPRIQTQVQRGSEIIQILNTFSHLSNEKSTTINLIKSLKHLVLISKRIAKQKNIDLYVKDEEQYYEIKTNPLQLYMVLFYSMELLMNYMKEYGKINFYPEKNIDNFKLHIACEGDLNSEEEFFKNLNSSEEWEAISRLTQNLYGHIEYDESNKSIVISLPQSPT